MGMSMNTVGHKSRGRLIVQRIRIPDGHNALMVDPKARPKARHRVDVGIENWIHKNLQDDGKDIKIEPKRDYIWYKYGCKRGPVRFPSTVGRIGRAPWGRQRAC